MIVEIAILLMTLFMCVIFFTDIPKAIASRIKEGSSKDLPVLNKRIEDLEKEVLKLQEILIFQKDIKDIRTLEAKTDHIKSSSIDTASKVDIPSKSKTIFVSNEDIKTHKNQTNILKINKT